MENGPKKNSDTTNYFIRFLYYLGIWIIYLIYAQMTNTSDVMAWIIPTSMTLVSFVSHPVALVH